jgi:hypothetical protein
VVKASRSPRLENVARSSRGLVVERRQERIVKGLDEHIVNEVFHRLAAPAMGECHGRNMHRAAPTGVDLGNNIHTAPSMVGCGCWRFTPPY